jgi:transposase
MNTPTSTRYVGLDVHKREVTACIVDPKGKQRKIIRFPLTRQRLTAFAQVTLRPTDHVALEATTNSWAVADVLRPHVARVVVSNPMATKAIAQAKVKTDKVDAAVLAHLLRCDYLPEVWQPDGDGGWKGRYDVDVKGAPVKVVGEYTLKKKGTGCDW